MSRKRPITHDFNSMFGAPINLKKTKEKLINGKVKQKEKNKENEIVAAQQAAKKKKKEKKTKKENKEEVKHEPIMKSPPPKSKKVFLSNEMSEKSSKNMSA